MSEWKTLGTIEAITDTDNGYDRVGEINGSFHPPEALMAHVRRHGHAELLEALASMTAQVMACADQLRREASERDEDRANTLANRL